MFLNIIAILIAYYSILSKTEKIELQVISTRSFISKVDQVNGFLIYHRGRYFKSLNKTEFKLINTGYTPITSRDIFYSLTFDFWKR